EAAASVTKGARGARVEDAADATRQRTARARLGLDPSGPVLALLPGSRRMEIRRCLAPMLEAARLVRAARPEVELILPVAETLDRRWVQGQIAPSGLPVRLVAGRALEVLTACDAAVVVSGTATLEAALARRPMVVVYRVSWLTWLLARLLVRTPYVSLVNLLAGRALVPELLQGAMEPRAIAAHLNALLPGGEARERVLRGLDEVRRRLGGPGTAERVAEEARRFLTDGGIHE
ncbi:MAG: lipid-A-disaccharide synthase, partial [Deltaproteobacteria bacterium]